MLKDLEFYQQIFEKYPNIKCHDIHPVGAELFQANRQTDGQTWRSHQPIFAILQTRLKSYR